MILNVYYLLKQIAEEDNKMAFEKLHRLYAGKMYSFAMFFLKSSVLSEDVVSDVFLKLWKNRKKLPQIRDWNAFLFICVRNQALKYMEQDSVRFSNSLDDFTIELAVDTENPEINFLKGELEELINLAVASLPDRCRMIFYLVREEKMSYKQVAELLKISERTVNTQLTIATKKIATALKSYLEIEKRNAKS